jgi:DNA-binding NtrC family response regulator
LNVIPFQVPPLRERKEDIPALASYFLADFARGYGRRPKELTPQALQLLQEYHWPGNVRELRNLIERIVILNPQSRIDARNIPLQAARKPAADRVSEGYGRRARLHPEETGRSRRECQPNGGVTGLGAQQSVSKDAGLGYRAAGMK